MNPVFQLCCAPILSALAPFSVQAAKVRDFPHSKISAHTWVIHGPPGYPSPETGFDDEAGKYIGPAAAETEASI